MKSKIPQVSYYEMMSCVASIGPIPDCRKCQLPPEICVVRTHFDARAITRCLKCGITAVVEINPKGHTLGLNELAIEQVKRLEQSVQMWKDMQKAEEVVA